MNIQIFGKAKCFDTKKAERYFKERGIKFQSIDITKYGISKGEYLSVKSDVGGMDALIDENSKAYTEQFIKHLARMEIRFSDYKTVKETSVEWGITERWVLMYCNNGRIDGAMKKGNLWFIPASAEKPEDGRRNNGRKPTEGRTEHE